MNPKQRLLAQIKVKFESQGGTGYDGLPHYRGCFCAITAAAKPHHKLSVHRQLMEGFGVEYEDVDLLAVAHDENVREAHATGLAGCQVAHGAVRALFGTPAYEFVWAALEAWAA